MTDEKYFYIQDIKDKKSTARSARNRRSRTGKGGSVKLPSDYMTKKEIKAMSSEVRPYRLNEPMTWKEFKAMPDDLKVMYIKALQSKFNVPETALAEMFGVIRQTVGKMLKELNIDHRPQGSNAWDKEGFANWRNGVKAVEEQPVEEPVEEAPICVPIEEHNEPRIDVAQKECISPYSGTLCFVGTAKSALDAVKNLLGSESVKITISWEAV